VTEQRPCPNCGEPVDPRQLVCLNCGGRVALAERRSWANEPVTAIAAALMAVIVIGAGLFGFAIAELTGDDGDGGGDQAAQAEQGPGSGDGPAVIAGEGQDTETSTRTTLPPDRTETAAETATDTVPTETTPAPARGPGGLPGWPAGLRAHTVVLVTSSDGPAARRVAREARRSGLEAGLFRSDPYDLGTGLWVVYSGRFDTREGAARQAAGLQERYPGAYPQLVQRGQ
jgi:zinc-ribbon domain